MGNPIIHWDLMVSDPERAKTFYRKLFDWRFDEKAFPGYTLIDTGKDPGGGLMPRPASAPTVGLNTYFEVSDLPRTLHDVVEMGGKVLVPRTEIPNMGAYAMFADPDGIAVGILQPLRR